MSKSKRRLGCLLLVLACGDGGGPSGPAPSPTATVSGIVREGATGTPIANAAVTVGTTSVTAGADGRFTIQSALVGPAVTISVSAAGFDTYSQIIAVQPGNNTHDVALIRRTIFERTDMTMYLPPGVSTFRGVLFLLPGFEGDSRELVRGEATLPEAVILQQRFREFARVHGFALLGNAHKPNDPMTYDFFLSGLASFATQSGRPELANAPLLLVGHSAGGCAAYGFTRLHSERVIGFITVKGGCHVPFGALGAQFVPAYLFIGEEDTQERANNITALFDQNRALGAPWALAIEPGTGHEFVSDHNLLDNWMNTVIALRLPSAPTPGQPVMLRPIDPSAGWLGDRTTFVIGAHSCYPGAELQASWLPAEQNARDWQRLVSGRTVTTVAACAHS